MTPKEHAEYFLAKFNFIPVNNGYSYTDTLEIRKRCALIAVNEILKENLELPDFPETIVRYLYWQEVKQEIEAL